MAVTYLAGGIWLSGINTSFSALLPWLLRKKTSEQQEPHLVAAVTCHRYVSVSVSATAEPRASRRRGFISYPSWLCRKTFFISPLNTSQAPQISRSPALSCQCSNKQLKKKKKLSKNPITEKGGVAVLCSFQRRAVVVYLVFPFFFSQRVTSSLLFQGGNHTLIKPFTTHNGEVVGIWDLGSLKWALCEAL